jgi:hypothetical protein
MQFLLQSFFGYLDELNVLGVMRWHKILLFSAIIAVVYMLRGAISCTSGTRVFLDIVIFQVLENDA